MFAVHRPKSAEALSFYAARLDEQYPDLSSCFAEVISDVHLGRVRFADGASRTVLFDQHGQYVFDDRGWKVYGVWVHPDLEPDQPLVVPRCEP